MLEHVMFAVCILLFLSRMKVGENTRFMKSMKIFVLHDVTTENFE